MSNIFIVSDLHFSHTNIIKYCSRSYKDAIEMNKDLIDQWNSRVSPTDRVWNLGDIGWNNGESLKDIFYRLNGNHEILVRGNHDKGSNGKYYSLGFKQVYKDFILINHKVTLADGFNSDFIGFKTLTHTVKIALSHKPILSETQARSVDADPRSYLILDDAAFGFIDLNIHGHIHNQEREILKDGKHFNASIEVIGYTPILLDDILARFILEDK